METDVKAISVKEFAKLNYSQYTLVDLREPDELLVSGIEGAINIPFSKFATQLDTIPKDKPVIVFCRVGDFSEQVAEILTDRGYDVKYVEGGYSAYRKLIEGDTVQKKEVKPQYIDAKGLKCPGPIVKVADYLRDKPEGTRIHVEATEDAFYSDIQIWCERTGNKLDDISFTDGVISANITHHTPQKTAASQSMQNDKTFVVFSGDLDKTIAAFIMANGAAAMGRKVTMFFTFWGLNILRRPKRSRSERRLLKKCSDL